VRLTNTHF